MSKTKVTICPYCGETQPAAESCRSCRGLFEPLSRQATHNQMGPWFIRDAPRPFQPGCSYETLLKLIQRGQVTKYSIIRGPTTRQFWTVARHVPGISHLLGYCHNCDAQVDAGDHGCHACGVAFGAYLDRNFLGLPEIRPLPWELDAGEEIRETARGGAAWARSTRGGSLSSFATDEELYGHSAFETYHGRSASMMPIERGSAGAGGELHADLSASATSGVEPTGASGTMIASATSPMRQPRPHIVPVTRSGAAATEESALRAMRRRVDQQHRTIRLLAFALVAMVVLVMILNIRAVSSLWQGDADPAGGDQTPASTIGE